MITFLTLLTAIATLVFLAVVALALVRIVDLLGDIGGRGDSYLAKLRLGLRAIERETSHLPAAAPEVNGGLSEVAEGLKAVDETLGGVYDALKKQEART